MTTSAVPSVDIELLSRVTGGAGPPDPKAWESFLKQSERMPNIKTILENNGCPQTPEEAKALGDKCLAELGPLKGLAKGYMESSFAKLFPK